MINTVAIIGRFCDDPTLRYTPTGKGVAGFTIASNDGWGDNQQTYYIDCVAWTKRAETIAERCKKGSLVGVKGKLTTRTYKNKEDKNVKVTEVLVEDIQFLDAKKSEDKQNQDPFANDSRTFEITDDMLPF